MAAWSRKTLKKNTFLRFFWKKDPLRENFQNSVPKGFIATSIDVWCSNFVKFGHAKSVKSCVIYLTKLTQKFIWLFSSRNCADRAQNLSEPAPYNVLRMRQISSKSVYFRRSCIRTREHRQSAIESESNIWLKRSLEPNNCAVKTVNRANQITSASKKSILVTVNEKESRKIIIKTEKKT